MCCGWSWQGGAEAGRDAHCPNGMGGLGTQLLGKHRQLLLRGLAAGRAQGDQCLGAAFFWDTVRHQLGSAPAGAWQRVRFLAALHQSLPPATG